MATTVPSPESRTPSPSLPPSPRDVLAYQRHVLEFASTRQTADEFKISQTRVRQIVRRVADWLAQALPPHNEARDAAHLRLAQHIASDRLYRYLDEAHLAWSRTHESKYMTTILRLMTALSKLPAQPGTLAALLADALEGPLPNGASFQPTTETPLASPHPQLAPSPTPSAPAPTPPSSFSIHPSEFPTSPPIRACSPTPTTAINPAVKALAQPPLSPNPPTPSNNHSTPPNSTRQAFLTPAHSTTDAPITELKITPKSTVLSPPNHSNRRDRRRLKRLLANK